MKGFLILAVLAACASAAPAPHIILVALDDYGWADSWHSPAGSNESQIPTLRALVAEGIDLARHYVFQYCSPSRSALHTGRNPLHVNVLNSYLDIVNAADPISGYQGIPLRMTLLPAKLQEAGYATHFVGKSHLGMATPAHIPTARGYNTSLHYFSGANDVSALSLTQTRTAHRALARLKRTPTVTRRHPRTIP